VPPLTIENAGALVEGGGASVSKDRKESNVQKPAAPTMVEFTVARAFYYQGKPLEVGKTYQLPRVFAVEMKNANKGRIKVVEPWRLSCPTARSRRLPRRSAARSRKRRTPMLGNEGQVAVAAKLLDPVSAAATVNATSGWVDVRGIEGDVQVIAQVGALTGSITWTWRTQRTVMARGGGPAQPPLNEGAFAA
jgi:hypothetical protein